MSLKDNGAARMASEQKHWLDAALDAASQARVAVFGDFCLDAYWLIDSGAEELSIETGLSVRRVRTQRYNPGGAGNVAANLSALNVAEVRAVGLVGDDLFGDEVRKILGKLGVGTQSLLNGQTDWQTMVFGKPCIGGDELNRIDFGSFNAISSSTIDRLAREVARVAGEVDLVILNQQVPAGVSTPAMIAKLNDIIADRPGCPFMVDSRHRPEVYHGAMLKINAHEAARVAGSPQPRDVPVPTDEARRYCAELHRKTSLPVFLTRGVEGLLVADEGGITDVPGIPVRGRVDPVGAGDTVVATLAAVLAGGSDPVTAAKAANMAASITVRKRQTTGTATPAEIRRLGRIIRQREN